LVIRIPQVFIVNFQLQASKLLQNSDPYRLWKERGREEYADKFKLMSCWRCHFLLSQLKYTRNGYHFRHRRRPPCLSWWSWDRSIKERSKKSRS
jgi:hypothetical protein